MTFVAFMPCLMHDLHIAAVFEGAVGAAFGGVGTAAGAVRADAAALA